MSRKKRLIIIPLLAAIVLVGTIAGVAYAQSGTTGTANVTPGKTLQARIATILGIDQKIASELLASLRERTVGHQAGRPRGSN